uniref:DUF4773 domain-containing protein n=1 Tax=Trichogramma kaykai TaxID=54128 RepID=A0ABD2WBY1_9HYME
MAHFELEIIGARLLQQRLPALELGATALDRRRLTDEHLALLLSTTSQRFHRLVPAIFHSESKHDLEIGLVGLLSALWLRRPLHGQAQGLRWRRSRYDLIFSFMITILWDICNNRLCECTSAESVRAQLLRRRERPTTAGQNRQRDQLVELVERVAEQATLQPAQNRVQWLQVRVPELQLPVLRRPQRQRAQVRPTVVRQLRLRQLRVLDRPQRHHEREFYLQQQPVGARIYLVLDSCCAARHPPPVCLPLPYLPFLHFCLRFFDLRLPNGTAFHTCIDFEARIIHAPLLILHFDCVDIGSNGLSWSKPQIGNDQLINNSYVEELTSSTFGSVSSTTSTTTTTTSPTTIDWDPVEFETTTESDGLPINGTTLSPEQEDKIGEHRLRHA